MECEYSLGKVPDLVRVERYQQNAVGLTSAHAALALEPNSLIDGGLLSTPGIVQKVVGLLTNTGSQLHSWTLSRWMRGTPSCGCVMQRKQLLLSFAHMRLFIVGGQQWLVSCHTQQPRSQKNPAAKKQTIGKNFKHGRIWSINECWLT